MGSKYTKRYTAEFKRDAIALVDSSGKTVTTAARELDGELAQFGEFGERGGDVAGADVWEGLGDPVDVLGSDAEGQARVAQGVAGTVGLRHASDGDAFGAEALDDAVVDLEPAGGFHARRAAIAREAAQIRMRCQRLGYAAEHTAAAIREGLAEVTALEAWRLALGWSRADTIAQIAELYAADGLMAPALSESMLCRAYRATPEQLGLHQRVRQLSAWTAEMIG